MEIFYFALFILSIVFLFMYFTKIKFNNEKIINVLGNGRSLKNFDFTKLEGETIGTCLAYRYWYKVNWFPDHYCCVDDVVIKSNVNDIKKLIINNKCKTFLLTKTIINHWEEVKNYNNVYYLEDFKQDKNNIFHKFDPYCTGSSACLYAYLLGASQINLFGIDCNYTEFLPETERLKDGSLKIKKTPNYNPNYFIDDYQREGDNYNIPRGKTVHLKSWELINKKLNDKCKIINYNKTDKLDKLFNREKKYKDFIFK